MRMVKNKKCFQIQFESHTFDEAIALTGYGRFHYKVVTICALCILSVGLENGLSSFVFPFAQCDLKITSSDVGLINVAFLFGGTCSGFMWGIISDMNGRKNVLLTTILINASITVLCSFMTTFTGVLICRFLNGFFVGCPATVSFTYLAEFHPPKYRAKSVCYSGIFFISAWVILPLIAYFILPMELCAFYKSWRLFLVIIAAPQLVAGFCLTLLPESPKFLVHKACVDEALVILRKMYLVNKNEKGVDDYPVVKLQSDAICIDPDEFRCRGKIMRILGAMLEQLRKLYNPPLRKSSYIMCVITFCNMFGYFGLGLWLPEFFMSFDRQQQLHPNETINIKDFRFSQQLSTEINCKNTFNEKTLKNTLTVATSALITMIISGRLTEKIGLKTVTFVTMVFGCLSSGCIYWAHSTTDILILSSVFQSTMTAANMVLGCIAVEIFPTAVTAAAHSITLCAGRVGAIFSNMLFSLFVDRYLDVMLLLVSGVILLGAIVCVFISIRPEPVDSTEMGLSRRVEISVVSFNDSVGTTNL